MRRLPWFAGLPREVAVLSGVAFCVALGFGIVVPALPVFATSFGVSATEASAVISAFALARLVGAPPAGWLVNRIGERAVLATGLTVVAVSSALAGLATTFGHLLVMRGVGGFGSAMFTVSAMALLLRSVGPEQRGQAAGAFQGGFLLGGIAGPAVGGIVTGISLRLPFFVYAGTLAAAVLVVLTLLTGRHLPDGRHAADDAADDAVDEDADDGAHRPGKGAALAAGWRALRRAAGQRAYVTAVTVNLGNGFTVFGIRSAILPLFVVYSLGLDPGWTGYGLLVGVLVQAALQLPAGRVADTTGRRPALLAGTAATAAGFVVLAAAGSLGWFLVSMAVLGVGSAFLATSSAAVLGDVTDGRRRGPEVAAYQIASDVGAITGPLLAGYLADRSGSYQSGFLLGAAVVAVGFALAAVTPETLRRSSAPDDRA